VSICSRRQPLAFVYSLSVSEEEAPYFFMVVEMMMNANEDRRTSNTSKTKDGGQKCERKNDSTKKVERGNSKLSSYLLR